MRPLYILLIIITFSVFDAQAQNDLDRQVDVSRDFTPDVDRALKRNIVPEMVDTVALRPDLDYTIRPSAWVTGFGVAAIYPARIDPTAYNPIYPLYLKIGGGYPGQSMLDFYYASTKEGVNGYGLYLNHRGQWSGLKDDMNSDRNAASTVNSAGLFGKVGFRRMVLSGEAGVDYDLWTPYGNYDRGIVAVPVYDRARIGYLTPRAQIGFGNDFKDMTYVNFRVGGGFYYFKDRNDNAETGYNARFEVGKMFSGHRVILDVGLDGRKGADGYIDGQDDNILLAGLRYEVLAGQFQFGASALVANEWYGEDTNFRFLPSANISVTLADGAFTPFAEMTSDVTNNGYRSLTRMNPFLREGITLPGMSTNYKVHAGFKGSVGSAFSYKLYAGGERWLDMPFYVYDYTSGNWSLFDVFVQERINAFTAGAEFEGRISGSFSVTLSGKYRNFDSKNWDQAFDLPEYEGSFAVKYVYGRKFSVSLGADLIGKIYFYERYDNSANYDFFVTENKAVFDIRLDAEYMVNDNFGVFLSGTNLANQKLYRFNHYRGQGVGVSAGVKLLF